MRDTSSGRFLHHNHPYFCYLNPTEHSLTPEISVWVLPGANSEFDSAAHAGSGENVQGFSGQGILPFPGKGKSLRGIPCVAFYLFYCRVVECKSKITLASLFWVKIPVFCKMHQVFNTVRRTWVGHTVQKNNSSCSQLWNNLGLKQSSLPMDGTAPFLTDSGGFRARNLIQPLPWADLARFVKSERIPALGGPACVQVCLRNASSQRSWVNV